MISAVQAKAAGNGKGVAYAGHADQQTVCRAQGFGVEFAAGVFHAWRPQGIAFQFLVVGCRDGLAAVAGAE